MTDPIDTPEAGVTAGLGEDLFLRKAYVADEQDVDTAKREGHAALTVRMVDRDGDVVEPMGGRFEEYWDNPIVFWNHGFGQGELADLPIGQATQIEPSREKVAASWRFSRPEANPKAEMIFQLWSDGDVNGVSQSFWPNRWSEKPVMRGQTGLHVTDWTLWEFGPVGIPINPKAIGKRSKGFQQAYKALTDCSPVYAPLFIVEGGRIYDISEQTDLTELRNRQGNAYAVIEDFLTTRSVRHLQARTRSDAEGAAQTALSRGRVHGIQLTVLAQYVGETDGGHPVYANLQEFYLTDDQQHPVTSCACDLPDGVEGTEPAQNGSAKGKPEAGSGGLLSAAERLVDEGPVWKGVASQDHDSLERMMREITGTAQEGVTRLMREAMQKAVVKFESVPKDTETDWDGSRARDNLAEWASSDGSGEKDTIDWAKYRRGFAWYDADEPEEFGSYKFPHHDIIDGEFRVLRSGVIAASNAIQGARSEPDIPEGDVAGVRGHLNKERERFDDLDPIEEDDEAQDEAHVYDPLTCDVGTSDAHDAGTGQHGPLPTYKGQVIDNPVGDYKWYSWDGDEARQWVEDHDEFEVLKEEKTENFHDIRVRDPDQYDRFRTKWQGRATKPEDEDFDDDDRPILFQFGFVDDEDRGSETQALRFYHGEADHEDGDEGDGAHASLWPGDTVAKSDGPAGVKATKWRGVEPSTDGERLAQSPRARRKSMRALPHIATKIFNEPLMIEPDRLETIVSVLAGESGWPLPVNPEAMQEEFQVDDEPDPPPFHVTEQGIAVIPIVGTLVHRAFGVMALSGLTSYADVQEKVLKAVEDDRVKAIALEIDSSGGEVNGAFDTVDAIAEARGEKPIWAIVNEMAYSAGYALASAADRIVLPRTAGLGSVGVVATHVDQSGADEEAGLEITFIHAGEKKVDGNPHEPLSERAEREMQDDVDRIHNIFVPTVAANRGLSEEAVRATEAGKFHGEEAVDVGFADAVMSAGDAFADLAQLVSDEEDIMQLLDDIERTRQTEARGDAEANVDEADPLDELLTDADADDGEGDEGDADAEAETPEGDVDTATEAERLIADLEGLTHATE